MGMIERALLGVDKLSELISMII